MTLEQLDKLSRNGKSYTVKFDDNLKPYIEVSFQNYFKGKDITTIVFTYGYQININGVNVIDAKSKILKSMIKSGSLGKIRINFRNDELKGHRTPDDIKVTTLVINNVRFSNVTVYNKNIPIFNND